MSIKNLQQYISQEEFTAAELPEAGELNAEVVVDDGTALDADVTAELVGAEVEIPATDESITDEQVELAEDDIVEADEATEVDFADLKKAETVQDQIAEETASVEHYMTVLKHGIKTKSYSPQFAATAQRELNKLNETFGGVAGTPSLESFATNDLSGYYEASLESFSGFVKRLSDAGSRLQRKLFDKMLDAAVIDRFKKKAAAVNTRADSLAAAVAAAPGDITLSVPKALLQAGSTDLLASLSSDLKISTASGTSGLDSSEKYVTGIMQILTEAFGSGGANKTGAIIAKALALKTPDLPAEAFSTGLVGGRKFVKKTAKEGSDTASKITHMIKTAYPDYTFGKVAKADVTLTKAQIGQLLKLAKAYAALGVKVADNSGKKSLENWDKSMLQKGRMMSAEPTTWAEGKAMDNLASGIWELAIQHHHLYLGFVDHVTDTGNAIVSLLEKATKTKAKAPAAAE